MKVKKENIENINFEKLWDELPVAGKLDSGQKERMWEQIDLKMIRPAKKNNYWWVAAAATVLMVAGSAIALNMTSHKNYLEVISYESSKTILLQDSTEIILGQHSKLKYPAEFGWFNRDVSLEGNAIFKVKHNGKSFTVTSGGFKTKVLGTFFKVDMSPDYSTAKVSLFEGKVQVSYKDSKTAILKPGDQWSYNTKKELPNLNHQENLTAKNVKLDFKNASLTEVLKQLSLIYGVKISSKEGVNEKMKITGTFYYSTPLQSLEEMGYPFGLSIKKINKLQYEIK